MLTRAPFRRIFAHQPYLLRARLTTPRSIRVSTYRSMAHINKAVPGIDQFISLNEPTIGTAYSQVSTTCRLTNNTNHGTFKRTSRTFTLRMQTSLSSSSRLPYAASPSTTEFLS